MPGPVDVVPGEEDPEPPAVSRTRVLVTAGAVAAGLAFVVAVGRGGAGDAGTSLRSEGRLRHPPSPSHSGAPTTAAVVLVVPDPADQDTLRRLEDGQVAEDERLATRARTTSRPTRTSRTTTTTGTTVDPVVPGVRRRSYGDADQDFPSYRPTLPRRTTSPQRLPVIPAPRVTTPAAVTTTPEPEPEPEPETTTTLPPAEETTTTSSAPAEATTTTTPPPAPAWARRRWACRTAHQGLKVWAHGDGLVAAVGATLYQQAAGALWTPLGEPIPGAGAVRAFVRGTASAFWVATDVGVFAKADGAATLTPLAARTDVRALAVSPNGSSLLAVTETEQLRRWDDAGASWSNPITLPVPAGTELGHVSFVNDTDAILGTSAGVIRLDDGSWMSVSSSAVVGQPVRGRQGVLLAGHGGGRRAAERCSRRCIVDRLRRRRHDRVRLDGARGSPRPARDVGRPGRHRPADQLQRRWDVMGRARADDAVPARRPRPRRHRDVRVPEGLRCRRDRAIVRLDDP